MRTPKRSIVIGVLSLSIAVNARGETEVEGDVSGRWSLEGSPYIAVGAVQVPNGETLTIDAGVQVQFEEGIPLLVYGRLTAVGSQEDSIFFMPVNGGEGWGGIRLLDADSLTRFDYCVVTKGRSLRGEGEIDSVSSGGNMFIWRGMVMIEHTRISEGRCRSIGGGIALWDSNPTISECLIADNETQAHGGGVGMFRNSSPAITNTIIQANTAAGSGGGMILLHGSSPVVEGCLFIDNDATTVQAGVGGAVALWDQGEPVFRRSDFVRNNSEAGGAVYVRGENAAALFEWCNFTLNATNVGSRVGGALYIRGSSPTEVRYCRFDQNNANNGGALYVKEPPQCRIHHNLFLRNSATSGGGAVSTSNDLGETPLRIDNCTFVGNRSIGIEAVAHTVQARGGSSVRISSSIVTEDRPQFAWNEGTIEVVYSNVNRGFDGEENSADDPEFFDLDTYWYLLKGNSNCVDNGEPDLPEDSDGTQNDRGWMHFPQDIWDSVAGDTVSADVTTATRANAPLRLTNTSDVPVFASPMDNWTVGQRHALHNVTAVTGDSSMNGVAWTEAGYFLTGGSNDEDPNKIYHLDTEFELLNQFEQPNGHDGAGFYDLAASGDILYGGDDEQIVEFTINGEPGEIYEIPVNLALARGLAVDIFNPHGYLDFYIGGGEGYIVRADGEMWPREQISIGDSIRAIGMKWNTRALYIVTQPLGGDPRLSLVIPVAQDSARVIPLFTLNAPLNNRIGGIEITQDFEAGHGTMVGVWQGPSGGGDVVFVEDIYTSWLVIVPEWRMLMPGEGSEWQIGIAGDQMPEGTYDSQICLAVNGYGANGWIPARMRSTLDGAPRLPSAPPSMISLHPVYPNPFNDRARISFDLQSAGGYELGLFNALGRRVSRLEADTAPAGTRSIVLDGRGLASGTYILRLESGGFQQAVRVVKVK